MTIVLKPEQEKAIEEAIQAGSIRSVDVLIDTVIEALNREKEWRISYGWRKEPPELLEPCPYIRGVISRGEAVRRMPEFGEEYRLSLGEPITRNLLHEGHRL